MSKNKSYQELLNLNIKAVAGTESGKAVLWHMLGLCNINGSAYTGDNNHTNYLAGKQSVGHDIIAVLEDADPTIYPNLILTNIEEMNDDD